MQLPAEIQKRSQMPSQLATSANSSNHIRKVPRRRSDATPVFDMTTTLGCAREYADSSAHVAHHHLCGTMEKPCMHSSCLRDRLHGVMGNCSAEDDLWEVIAIVCKALCMKRKKDRLIMKIVQHHSRFASDAYLSEFSQK